MVDSSCSDLERAKTEKLEKKSTRVNPKVLSKVRDEVETACNHYRHPLDKTWAARALVVYGKRKIKALCQFIKDEGINDLHGHNIGYLNGKPILLDFCGYYGE